MIGATFFEGRPTSSSLLKLDRGIGYVSFPRLPLDIGPVRHVAINARADHENEYQEDER